MAKFPYFRGEAGPTIALALAVAVAFSILVTELTIQLFREFWVGHAILAGLVVGLVQLGLTVFVLDSLLASREKHRWRPVFTIAAEALGEAAVFHYRSLWRLAFGGPDPAVLYSNSGLVVGASSWADPRQLLHAHDLDEVGIRSGFQGQVGRSEWDARWKILAADPQWIRALAATCMDINRCYRFEVSQWASALVSAKAGSQFLEGAAQVASLNSQIIVITDPAIAERRELNPEEQNKLLETLQECRKRAVLLRERMQREAGLGDEYQSRLRNALPEPEVAWLSSRHQRVRDVFE